MPTSLIPCSTHHRAALSLIVVKSRVKVAVGSPQRALLPVLNRIRSVPDAIARALSEFLAPEEAEQFGLVHGGNDTKELDASTPVGEICPKCGNATFVYEEGCQKCHSCFHSEC